MEQNFIELVEVPFQASESRLFMVSGSYFEVIDATDPIDVILTDRYGAQRGRMLQAEASFKLNKTEFATIQLTSATAQTIRFAYGSGEAGTNRAAGAVSIVGTVPVDVQATVGLTDAQLRASAVNVSLQAVQPGAFWGNVGAIAANTATQIFSAAANVNGAIIWAADQFDYAAGANVASFVAKATAPATVVDGQVVSQNTAGSDYGASFTAEGSLKHPVRIAAGLGLYYFNNTALNGGLRSCRYTLL